MSNLVQRVLTSLVGAVVVVGAVWIGGWAFAVLMAVVAVLAQREVYGLLEAAGTRPLVVYGIALGALAVVSPLVPGAGAVLVLGGLGVLGAVLYRSSRTPLLDTAGTVFGVVYPALLTSYLVAVRTADVPWLVGREAFWLTAMLLFCVWGSDSFAYFAGRAFGTHPLFPRVSPKKTWEGSAGGAVGAFALAAAFKVLALDGVLTWPDVVVVALACGVASQFGDLVESLFKRSVDVKDSATWIPGHGGMLDRIDAAVVAVPLVVIYLDLTKGLG